MISHNSVLDRAAALDVLNDHVPEIRGQLQFLDFLVRAVMTDLERYHQETDSGTRVFLKQLILMHLHHINKNGGQSGALAEFTDAVHHWFSSEEADSPEERPDAGNSSVQELLTAAVDTLNWSGGRV